MSQVYSFRDNLSTRKIPVQIDEDFWPIFPCAIASGQNMAPLKRYGNFRLVSAFFMYKSCT